MGQLGGVEGISFEGMSFFGALESLLVALLQFLWIFLQDAWMLLRGKAYKPSSPQTTQMVLRQVKALLNEPATFVDLGCGRGTQLPVVRDARLSDGRPLFKRVIGVELDEQTYRDALAKVGGGGIELVCACMFKFVEHFDFAQQQRTVLYMYEPLWAAGMPVSEIHRLYEQLLGVVAMQAKGTIIVYMTGVGHRHIPADMFVRHGFSLAHATMVANSGLANTLSGTANALEVWLTV